MSYFYAANAVVERKAKSAMDPLNRSPGECGVGRGGGAERVARAAYGSYDNPGQDGRGARAKGEVAGGAT